MGISLSIAGKQDLKQFVLDHLQSAYRDSALCRVEVDEGDLLIERDTGERVAVTVINRAIRFIEVKERYEQNTARQVHTLFLIDGRMMPPDRSEVEPPAWMLAIHALTNGRVYAYWCEGRSVTIRPLHLGWKWNSKIRPVQYGAAIDTHRLSLRRIETNFGVITGVYATADFDEGTFWKKHEPLGGQTDFYSWRTWHYSEPKQNAPFDDDPDWDPWEEFNHNYSAEEEYVHYEEPPRQRQAHQPPRPHPDSVHYATLGVSQGASLDEIKQAYRRKARENHPDLHPENREKYTAKMADINAAFEAISRKFGR